MYTETNKNVEDSRPNKKNIAVTITIAILVGIAFGAIGMWFSYQ
jgi:hypothetical protein